MKNLFAIFLILFAACHSPETAQHKIAEPLPDTSAQVLPDAPIHQEPKIRKNAVKGNFNGDGKPDFVWLVPPIVDTEAMGCAGPCISVLRFSDPEIPAIEIKNCIGGTPDNLGDLNGDGADEIGLLPSWFTSCWMAYYVWTLKSNQWVHAVDPISTHCSQWDEGVVPIEIDPKKKGYVIIRYSAIENEEAELVTKSKSVKIR